MANPSVERLIKIMEFLATQPGRGFTLSELARRVAISPATAHSVLGTLADRAFVVRNPDNLEYRLGLALVPIGTAAERSAPVVRTARREAVRLAQEHDCECVVAAYTADEILIVVQAGVGGPSSVRWQEGQRYPLVPPLGSSLIAWTDTITIETWLDRYGGDLTDPQREQYRAATAHARTRGFDVGFRAPGRDRLLDLHGRGDLHTAEGRRQLRLAMEALAHEDHLPRGADIDPAAELYSITAPIFGPDGDLLLVLTLLPSDAHRGRDVPGLAGEVVDAAQRVMAAERTGRRTGQDGPGPGPLRSPGFGTGNGSRPESRSTGNAAVERTVRVLEFLATQPGRGFTLSTLSRELGISVSTAHVLLTTLTDRAVLVRDPASLEYRLGVALVPVGTAAERNFPALTHARREARRLARQFDCDCTISGYAKDDIILIDRAAAQGPSGAGSRQGRRYPLAPPLGAAVVAWMDEPDVDGWLARFDGELTAVERDHYVANVERARRDGYHVGLRGPGLDELFRVAGEGHLHTPEGDRQFRQALAVVAGEQHLSPADVPGETPIFSVSAPVFDSNGSLVLVLGLLPRDALYERDRQALIRPVVQAAQRVMTAIDGRQVQRAARGGAAR